MPILLVDDDPAVRASISFALEANGFEVDSFATAEDLLMRAPARKPACIVLDYHLPGLDGLSLLRILRARGDLAPAILITSNPGAGLRQWVGDAGGRILEKPLLCDALAAMIRRVTGEAAGRA